MSESFVYRAAAATLRGRGHSQNQDAWAIVRQEGAGALYAVADGVSSSPRGQWAAQHTCRRLAALLREDPDADTDDLLQLVGEIDWELREEGKGSAACTLSLAWFAEGELYLLHVGDSSIFRIRNGRVMLLSQDMGKGSGLAKFMGMGPSVSDCLQIRTEALRPDDGYLLLTDGVTRVIRHTELAAWWLKVGRDPARCVGGVVREVDRRQGGDDATVVAVAVDAAR